MPPSSRLTPQERAFARAYAHPASSTRFNAEASALAAGYAPTTTQAGAYKLLRRPRIQRLITRYIESALPTVARIKQELADVATAPWRDFATIIRDPLTGTPLDVKLELKDRNKAAELYLRSEGAFEDPVKKAVGQMILKQMKQMQRGQQRLQQQAQRQLASPGEDILEAEVIEPPADRVKVDTVEPLERVKLDTTGAEAAAGPGERKPGVSASPALQPSQGRETAAPGLRPPPVPRRRS